MKSSYIKLLVGSAALVVPQLASATLVAVPAYLAAGWNVTGVDNGGNPIDYSPGTVFANNLNPITAALKSSNTVDGGGSFDGTYGSFDTNRVINPSIAGSPGNPGEAVNPTTGPIDFQAGQDNGFIQLNKNFNAVFTFSTSKRYVLGSLLFDAARTSNTSNKFNVSYSTWNTIDLNNSVGSPLATSNSGPGAANFNNQISGNQLPAGYNYGNYDDFDLSLGGLVLEAGQSIQFVFTVENTTGTHYLDNVALTVIPEPGSLVALGCLVGSGAFLRTRRRSSVATEA